MNNLIIVDEEFRTRYEQMIEFGDNVKGMQDALAVLMTSVAEVVFTSGYVGINLKYLCSQFAGLKEDLDELLTKQKTYIEEFISEIEIADKDIYVGV